MGFLDVKEETAEQKIESLKRDRVKTENDNNLPSDLKKDLIAEIDCLILDLETWGYC